MFISIYYSDSSSSAEYLHDFLKNRYVLKDPPTLVWLKRIFLCRQHFSAGSCVYMSHVHMLAGSINLIQVIAG